MASLLEMRAELRRLEGAVEKVRGIRKEQGDAFDPTNVDGIFTVGASEDDAGMRRLQEFQGWIKRSKELQSALADVEDAAIAGAEADRVAERKDRGTIERLMEHPEVRSLRNGRETSWIDEDGKMSLLDARAMAEWTVPDAMPSEIVRNVRHELDFLDFLPRIQIRGANNWRYYRQIMPAAVNPAAEPAARPTGNAAEPTLVGTTSPVTPSTSTGHRSGQGPNALPESAFEYNIASASIYTIGHQWPVPEENLEDIGMMQAEMESEGVQGVREALLLQIFSGSGTAPDLPGLTDPTEADGTFTNLDARHPGIRRGVKAAGTRIIDAIITRAGECATYGKMAPDWVVMHPTDYYDMRLETTGSSASNFWYTFADPTATPGRVIDGSIRIFMTTAITRHICVMGSNRYCRLLERRGIRLAMTDSHSDEFIRNTLRMKADGRYGFAVLRPSAFGVVTTLGT